jgi:hypothetical protein
MSGLEESECERSMATRLLARQMRMREQQTYIASGAGGNDMLRLPPRVGFCGSDIQKQLTASIHPYR